MRRWWPLFYARTLVWSCVQRSHLAVRVAAAALCYALSIFLRPASDDYLTTVVVVAAAAVSMVAAVGGAPGLAGYGLSDTQRGLVQRFDPGTAAEVAAGEHLGGDSIGFFVARLRKTL